VLNAFQAGATKVSVSASANRQQNLNYIEIADNGPGLPNKVKEHLFEPFQGSVAPGSASPLLAI